MISWFDEKQFNKYEGICDLIIGFILGCLLIGFGEFYLRLLCPICY